MPNRPRCSEGITMAFIPCFFRTPALLLAMALGTGAQAQTPAPAPDMPSAGLRFGDYLDAVERYSPQLGAEQQNVVSARAGVGIAGLRPDPQLSVGASREQVQTGQPRPTTGNYQISMELETGGKRGARIQAARSHVRLAEMGVEGLRNQLFSEAAQDFTQACRDGRALVRKRQTLQALTDVVQANEVRRRAGDIGGVELLQSRVERDRFQAEVAQARADAQTSRLALAVPLGRRLSEVLAAAGPGGDALQCEFQPFGADVPLEDAEALVARALQERSDVRTAQAALDNARDNAGVVQANRWVNPTVAVGMAAVPATGGGEAQGGTSRSRVLSVSVSVPLPLSRLDRGDLLQAESAVTQAMLGLQQAQNKAEADVRSARFRFQSAHENLERYREGVLRDAQRVLDGMRLSYRQGQASLLELLSAQRSADEAYLGSLEAETDLAKATVELQLSLGLRPAL
jgi:cobalt-zinc-cadmium efflux system outer membrane protein